MITKQIFFELLDKGREDNQWDFKQDIKLKPNEDFYQLLKDILAFSNSGGGYLLLGIEDKHHNLVGVTNKLDEAELGNKLQSTLGYSIDIKLLYFEENIEGENKTLGIVYIPESEKINVAPKNITGQKGVIIQEGLPYVRRNTQSVVANRDDYEKLTIQVQTKGEYEFKEWDLKILERNKGYFNNYGKKLYDYLKGDFSFTTNEFSFKIHEIYSSQAKYNKLEFGRLVGFEDHKIDSFFEGKAFPTLEQLLRLTMIFDLPADYFFRPTIYSRFPIWQEPMISYCIINKVKQKKEIFKQDNGTFFREVIWKLCRNIVLFINWWDSNIPPKVEIESDPIIGMFHSRPYDFLYDYLNNLSSEEIGQFKQHLSKQYYKIFELFERDARINQLEEDDNVLDILIQLDSEMICRIINECIKEINIIDGEVEVKVHFIEEIKNREINYREYDVHELALIIHKD